MRGIARTGPRIPIRLVDPTLERRRIEEHAGVEPARVVGAYRRDGLRRLAEPDDEDGSAVDGREVGPIDGDALVALCGLEQPRYERVTEAVVDEAGDLVASERHQVVRVVERVARAGVIGAGGRGVERSPVDTAAGTPLTAEVHEQLCEQLART
ncbi:hypothetical protein GCM10028858_27010 [Halorubrum pallidum]